MAVWAAFAAAWAVGASGASAAPPAAGLLLQRLGAEAIETTPLNEWPMLMTHDAATGYLTEVSNPIYAWTRTQPASATAFTAQLDCGARAFDLRGKVNSKGDLVFHHGTIEVGKDAREALSEVIAWANSHQALEDLVVIYSWDCDGCGSQMSDLMQELGIHIVDDCGVIAGLTLASASEMGKLAGGGSVLAVETCVDQNYDETLACSGCDHTIKHLRNPDVANLTSGGPKALPCSGSTYYHCWTGEAGCDFAFNRLVAGLTQVSTAGPQGGRLWELQALWQESAESIVIGVSRLSSLLVDETKSQLNTRMADLIKAGTFPHINLFEVNNVCDGGPELLAALREHQLRKAVARAQAPAVNYSSLMVA